MKQSIKRPKIRTRDRIFWVFLSCLWKDRQDVLIVVKPETVIRWHKKGFKLFWRYKSGKRGPGRSPFDPEIRKIIENMAKENLLWGAPRIHGELMINRHGKVHLSKGSLEVYEETASIMLSY